MNKIFLVLALLGVAGLSASFKIDYSSSASLSGGGGLKLGNDYKSEDDLKYSSSGAGLHGGSEKSFGKSIKLGASGAGSYDAGLQGGSEKSSGKSLQLESSGADSHSYGLHGGSEKSSGKSLQLESSGADSHGSGFQGGIKKSSNVQFSISGAGSHGEQDSKTGSVGAAYVAGLKGIGKKVSEYASKHSISGAGSYDATLKFGSDKSSGLGVKGEEQSHIDLAKGQAGVSKKIEFGGGRKLDISVQGSAKDY